MSKTKTTEQLKQEHYDMALKFKEEGNEEMYVKYMTLAANFGIAVELEALRNLIAHK